MISRRLARLSQPASELLAVAAVLAKPQVELLATLSGGSRDSATDALDEAVRARLMVFDSGGYEFAHALVRESIYDNLNPGLRARLHRAIARALESVDGSSPADLAHHWMRAGTAEDRKRAAAGAAVAHMGFEKAVVHYGWALDGGVEDPVGVHIAMGEAQVLGGALAEGRETLRTAAYEAERAGRGEDLARAVLAMGGGMGGFEVDVLDTEQVPLLTTALGLLPAEDTVLRAATLARLSLASAGHATPDERADLAQQAIAMARRLRDAAVEVSALAALCDALAGPDNVADRLAATDRMVELATGRSQSLLLLLVRRLRLVARLEVGDVVAVDAEISAYAQASDRLRVPFYAWPVPVWRGMRAAMDGDLERACRYADEADRETAAFKRQVAGSIPARGANQPWQSAMPTCA